MKTKYSLIPFIPAVIAAVGLKLLSIFGIDGTGLLFGMNKSTINYVIIGVTLALFAVCIVINLTDRKTAPVYAVKKNPVAGFMAMLSGFAAAGSSFLTLFNITTDNSDTYLMSIITAVFSVPAAVAMILIGKIHFVGKSKVSNHSMFYVLPALWSCAELVSEFLQATKVSISASDMTPLFCYIFITLYLFSSSMIVSRVKGKNPVKACFIYGFPAVTVCLACGVGTVATATIESMGVQSLLSGATFIVFALYILSFTLEIFGGCVTKAEIEIIDSLPKDDDTYENSYINSGAYDELIASDSQMPGAVDETAAANEPEEQPRPRTYAEVAAEDMNDFIMGYDPDAEYASRENSTDAGAYDFSHDLILGTEGVTEGEFIREMNPEPQTPANEVKPAPRTVMADEAQTTESVEQKPEKRSKSADKKTKSDKKAFRKPKTEKIQDVSETETVPETPKAKPAEQESRKAVNMAAVPAREAQQPRRSAQQQNRSRRSSANTQQHRNPRPAADSRSAQTARTGSRPSTVSSDTRRTSATGEASVRQARPVRQTRPVRPTQQTTRPVSQPTADNSVYSSHVSSRSSYGDYDDYAAQRHSASAADARSYDDTTVSSERMSDIDRLLKELEDKK